LSVKETPSQEKLKTIFSSITKLVVKVNYLKHSGVRSSYRAKVTADFHILKSMKCWSVIFRRWKNARKSLRSDKAISLIFKPQKMVLVSFCDGVPLKYKKKNWQASSLPAWIGSAWS
jgi:hypothetical protein